MFSSRWQNSAANDYVPIQWNEWHNSNQYLCLPQSSRVERSRCHQINRRCPSATNYHRRSPTRSHQAPATPCCPPPARLARYDSAEMGMGKKEKGKGTKEKGKRKRKKEKGKAVPLGHTQRQIYCICTRDGPPTGMLREQRPWKIGGQLFLVLGRVAVETRRSQAQVMDVKKQKWHFQRVSTTSCLLLRWVGGSKHCL